MRFGVFKTFRLLVVVLTAAVAGPVSAQLEITISSGVDSKFPVAVVPFGWEGNGAVPFDVASVVEQDLVRSGYFEALERRNMVSSPSTRGELNLLDWRIVDVDVLLFGRVLQNGGDNYTIEFLLYDVIQGTELLANRVTTSSNQFRRTAHRIADIVYEEMTGIPGIFDTRIAYITEERRTPDDRTFRLIVADADGENAATIAESAYPLMSPAWSPDGRRIAYVSFEDRDRSVIYVQTVSTGNRERVSSRPGNNQSPEFSPDGRELALTLNVDDGNFNVYTLNLAGQVLSRITRSSSIDTEAVWSPNGRQLYFLSDRSGSPQIYRIDALPGNRAQRITIEGRSNSRPRISPDGSQLAMIHRDSQGRDRIATQDLDSGVLNVLTRGQNDESPSFAPNGAMIIYATRVNGRGVLAAVSTDGRIQQEIASVEGEVREPVWSPYRLP